MSLRHVGVVEVVGRVVRHAEALHDGDRADVGRRGHGDDLFQAQPAEPVG
jgi:hypothetical protein